MKSLQIVAIVLFLAVTPTVFSQTRSRPPLRNSDQYEQNLRAHERGYRTGYEDGFTLGKEDFSQEKPREFSRSQDYQQANRKYDSQMGRLSEYQDGYHLGFEMGYNDGYLGRPFSASVPQNLTTLILGNSNVARQQSEDSGQTERRDRARDEPRDNSHADAQDDRRSLPNQRESNQRDEPRDTRPEARDRGITRSSANGIFIPDGDQLRIRLTSSLNTRTNREGDQFTARVVSPSDYANATIVGHIARITHSGKATGKTEILLAFDEITTPEGQSAPFDAQVEKIYEGATVKTVDEEGNVQSGSQTKDTAVRGVGGAALGAIIGGIAGGGKGAAIGATIGGAAGAGSVYVQSGKDIILDTGTEMTIRSLGKPRK